jgi:hypothetical protein
VPRVLLNFQHCGVWWSVHFIKADCRTLIGPARVGIHQGPAVVRFRHVRALLPNRRQAGDR